MYKTLIHKEFKLFYLALFASLTLPISAQIELVGKASKTEVGINERFQLGFYVNIEGETRNLKIDEFLELPDLTGLQVLGVMDKRNMSLSNNRVINQIGQEIMVVAEKKGEIKIGSAKVKINGKKYTSAPFTIRVGGNSKSTLPQGGQRLEGAFLVAEVSNDAPFMNEAIVLTLKFYARDYTILQRRSELNAPDLTDFVVEIYPSSGRNLQQERINGSVYVSEELASYILFPKKAGRNTVPAFDVDLVLNNAFRSEKFKLTSPELSIEARPLPDNAPEGFEGAVGSFELLLDVDKKAVKQNESINFGVELVGDGNLNMISLPDPKLPKEIEVFKPKKRNKYRTTATGIKGKIAADYILVPQYGGSYALKPFRFTYFDPVAETFKTLETNPIRLEVDGDPPPKTIAKATPNPSTSTATSGRSGSEERVSQELEANVPLEGTEQADEESPSLVESKWVWALFGLGSLALLAGIVYLEKRRHNHAEDEEETKAQASPRAFKQSLLPHLKALEEFAKAKDSRAFMPKMESILTQSASFATQIEPAHFALEEVEKELEKNFKPQEVQEWGQLMRTAKAAQYAPQSLSANDLGDFAKKTEELANYFITNS